MHDPSLSIAKPLTPEFTVCGDDGKGKANDQRMEERQDETLEGSSRFIDWSRR